MEGLRFIRRPSKFCGGETRRRGDDDAARGVNQFSCVFDGEILADDCNLSVRDTAMSAAYASVAMTIVPLRIIVSNKVLVEKRMAVHGNSRIAQ